MTSIFISYSRKDIEVARKLTEAFKGQDLDFWIDWEGIPPTVDWWKEIQNGIEKANIFIFLISPDSAASKVCKLEIEHAAKNGKRLIPVVVRDIKADESPNEMRTLNWIFIRENDDFDSGFGKLINAIKTDYEWVQTHSQIQVKALEWERSHYENSLLLHGKELQDAEIELVANSSKEPYPTDLQREYVLKSRQATDRQRRTILSISVAGVIILAVLTVIAILQAGRATEAANAAETARAVAIANENARATAQAEAEERANIATARNAAIQAINLRDKRLDVALLLGVEANRRLDNYETQSVLFDNVRYAPRILQFRRNDNILAEDDIHSSLGELAGPDFYLVVVSQDGKIGAVGGDRTIQLWDIASRKMIGELTLPYPDPDISLRVLAFSKDGTKLASGTDGGELEIWDVSRQEVIAGPVGVEDFVTSISFSSNGNYIAVGQSTENVFEIYDVTLPTDNPASELSELPMAQPIERLEGEHNDFVNQIAFSTDDRLLASGDAAGTVVVQGWNASQGGFGPLLTLLGHPGSIVGLEFPDNGKTLLSTDATGMQIYWAIEARDTIEKRFEAQSLIGDSAISPDGNTLVFSDYLGHIVLVNIQMLRNMPLANSVESPIAIEPATTYSKNIVTDDIFLTFDPDNNILTYQPESGDFTVWDSSSTTPISHPLEPQVGVTDAAFSADGKILATVHEDGTITLWDVRSKSSIGILQAPTGAMYELELVPEGNLLVSFGSDNQILIWDLDTHKPIASPIESNGVMAVSPNGKILAYGDINGIPILFDLENYETIGSPLISHKAVSRLSFNHDGTILASSGMDSNRDLIDPSYENVILWEVASQRQIGQTLSGAVEGGGTTAVNTIEGIFSHDSGTLIVYDNLGNIILWNINVKSWVERSCQVAGRNFTQAEWRDYFPGEEYQKTCEQWPEGK